MYMRYGQISVRRSLRTKHGFPLAGSVGMLLFIINVTDSYMSVIVWAYIVPKKSLKLVTSTHFTLHSPTVCTRQLIPIIIFVLLLFLNTT